MNNHRLIKVARGLSKADIVIKNVKYLNVFTREFLVGDIAICDGYFAGISSEYSGIEEIDGNGLCMMPGLIDGHIHLESSIISAEQFAKTVLPHGTTTVITDPHEITNVLGTDGIDYMLETTNDIKLEVYFVVPSCVPCSIFDENGAELLHSDVEKYMKNERVLGLAEMMNYSGTISADDEILMKINAASSMGKVIDGHAPFLTGKDLNAYVAAGVESDHECTNYEEALEKIRLGQWLMVREGTASRNLNELLKILNDQYCQRCMFVTDDKHPGDLVRDGHIDYIVRKAIKGGVKPEIAYTMASFNVASYFGLKGKGAIAPGYQADFILVSDIEDVKIESVFKNGIKVDEEYLGSIKSQCNDDLKKKVYNTMNVKKISAEDIVLKKKNEKIIGLINGELLTTDEGETDHIDVENDILKMCVIERHKNTGHIGVCFVKGYGLKKGAIATSIAHDSHNIIVIGTNDSDIVTSVNALIESNGGMNLVENGKIVEELSLPIAGLMCDESTEEVIKKMDKLKKKAREMGVNSEIDPYMTMSFVSLPVIPKLKLTTKGVVDVEKFQLI